MPATETLLTFFATSVLLALAPGPDNLFVLTQSALRGKSAGLAVTLGLCTGLIVHTTAVTLGLAAIFAASALAFTRAEIVWRNLSALAGLAGFSGLINRDHGSGGGSTDCLAIVPAGDSDEYHQPEGFDLFSGFSAPVC